MKTLVLAATAACALLAAPAIAQAETTWYGNIGYTNVAVEELDANLGQIQGRAGVMFSEYFGAEAEVGFGVASDTVDFGIPVDVELTSLVAGYVVMNWPATDKLDVFVRAGWVTMEVEASVGGGSASESGSDSAVGFGAQYFLTEKDGIRGDWTNYGGTDSFSIAYVRKF